MTELRKDILEIIENSDIPLMAKTIHAQLGSKPDLSTIYRALDYFRQNKKLTRISFFDKVYYYYSCHKPHNHFLICQYCHGIEPFDLCTAKSIEPLIENRYGFSIADHRLHFVGLCRKCNLESDEK